MFVQDMFNNVGRHCSIPGDGNSRPRRWQVRAAVKRNADGWTRYLVKNVDTGRFRVVPLRDMHSLY